MTEQQYLSEQFDAIYNEVLLRGVHVALNSAREYLAKGIVIDEEVLREIENAWQRGFGERGRKNE